MKRKNLLLLACVAIAVQVMRPAWAEEAAPTNSTANEVKQDFKQFGKKFGSAVKKAGKEVGAATVTTTRSIKKKVKGDSQSRNFKPTPNRSRPENTSSRN